MLLCLCVSPPDAYAQLRVVDVGGTCPECRVVFDTVAVVGSLQDSVLIGDYLGGVLVMRGDTIAVGTGHEMNPVLVFAPDGRLDRALGEAGEGPGELPDPGGIVAQGDELILVTGRGRLSQMDLDGAVTTSAPINVNSSHSLTVGPSGRIVYGFPEFSAGVAGLRYQVFSPDLERVAVFDPIPSGLRNCRDCTSRATGWSTRWPGQFWAVPTQSYRIERWTAEGDQQSVRIIEGSNWLPATAEDALPADLPQSLADATVGATRPHPRVGNIDEGPAGRLWISGLAPPHDWSPLPRNATPEESLEWRARRWDSVVDVIDSESGEILTSVRFPYRQVFPTNGLHWYTREQSDLGVVSYVVLRARLVQN